MKEYPILFSAEMVRATLEKRKTRTMRPIIARNSTVLGRNVTAKSPLWSGLVWEERVYKDSGPHILHPSASVYLHVPYVNPVEGDDRRIFRVRSRYEIGDQFWGRETWATLKGLDDLAPGQITKAGILPIWYKADLIQIGSQERGRWRPSISMPRWASRLTLEITGIRAQRPQDITEADAKAEGVNPEKPWGFFDGWVKSFAWLWDFIYAKKGQGWDANPWCWGYEFKRVEEGKHNV